ncbi:hypothetical protein DITRI_Ditri19aG0001800 [Diplodiscus trichospermus]
MKMNKVSGKKTVNIFVIIMVVAFALMVTSVEGKAGRGGGGRSARGRGSGWIVKGPRGRGHLPSSAVALGPAADSKFVFIELLLFVFSVFLLV